MPNASVAEEAGGGVIPDRCHYIYASATHRMATAVVGLVNQMNAYAELRHAHEAVQLSINLGCRTAPMIDAVDCAISMVKSGGGAMIPARQVVACVEANTGQPFPALEN